MWCFFLLAIGFVVTSLETPQLKLCNSHASWSTLFLNSAVRHIGAALVGKNLCVHTTDLRFMPITDASDGNLFFVIGYVTKYLTWITYIRFSMHIISFFCRAVYKRMRLRRGWCFFDCLPSAFSLRSCRPRDWGYATAARLGRHPFWIPRFATLVQR